MTFLDLMIEKHRKGGLLVDANLLLLLFVGRTNPARVKNFKRTDAYSLDDYKMLERFIARFARTITTAHILTEVSNLAKLNDHELRRFRNIMKTTIAVMQELHEPSSRITTEPVFLRLGLTDAAISQLCKDVLVLTNDLDLFLHLQHHGVDAVNFQHLRAATW
jgi:hypothetical protein